jgi:hypothetical protein
VAALQGGGEATLLEETGNKLVYARRGFPRAILGFSEVEVFEYLAAMVTTNDPAVEELIRSAADDTYSGIMWTTRAAGYGNAWRPSGTPVRRASCRCLGGKNSQISGMQAGEASTLSIML